MRLALWMRLGLIIAAFGGCIMAWQAVDAQSATPLPIGYGQTLTGELAAPRTELLYAFAATQGDSIAITLRKTGGEIDPFLILLDSSQQNVLAVDNDSAGEQDARIRYVIPASGSYLIRATSTLNNQTSRGTYELSLSLQNPTPTPSATANAPVIAALDQGGAVSGDLNDAVPFRLYRIVAQASEQRAFTLDVSDGLQAGMYLYDATFSERLAVAELGQALQVVTPAEGQYFVVVARTGPQGAGSFTLRDTDAASAVSIAVGQSLRSSITPENPVRSYAFTGTQGQQLRVRMRRVSGDLAPYAYLVATDSGFIIAEGQPAGGLAEFTVTIPRGGSYAITVTREGKAEGTTTGDFILSVNDATGLPSLPAAFGGYTPLSYGTSFKGTIDDGNYLWGFSFYAGRGETIELTLKGGGGLAPFLLLQNENGDTISQSDKGTNPAVLRFRAMQAGFYGVLATRQDLKAGASSGAFEIAIAVIVTEAKPTSLPGDPVAAESTPTQPTVLVAGQTLQGDLTRTIASLHSFTVEANTQVRLDLVSEAALRVLVADSAFTQIAAVTGSLRDTLLAKAGTYYVLVTRPNGPNDSLGATYSLTLQGQVIAATVAPPTPPPVLIYGQPIQGVITADTYAIRYFVNAQAGETIRLSMEAAPGSSLDPYVQVLDPAGTILGLNDDSAAGIVNALLVVTFPTSGQYAVVATRNGEATGGTTGAFILRAEPFQPTPTPVITETPTPAPLLVLPPGIAGMRYGERVTGTIDPARTLNYFGFIGNAGDIVTIRMGRASGDLDCLLYLYAYDSNGNAFAIASNDNQAEGTTNAAIVGFTLPQRSAYLIIATRKDSAQGSTTGDFVLTLAQGGS